MDGDFLDVLFVVTVLKQIGHGASLARNSHTHSWLPANLLAPQKTKKQLCRAVTKNKQLSHIEGADQQCTPPDSQGTFR